MPSAPLPCHGALHDFDVIKATILGIVEGLTEYIPVSSTGHLLLIQQFFGFSDEDFGKTFTVLIQLGAILALLSIYFVRLWQLFTRHVHRSARPAFHHRRADRLPAGGGDRGDGLQIHQGGAVQPLVVCFALIAGGAVLLWVDRLDLKPRYHEATGFPLPMYLVIGLAQCLSMVPGVSRSGATIVSAMLLGADRRAAAEFSFWLAMPTMAGAFAFDLYKSHAQMSSGNLLLVAVGFVVSFICAWFVVKTFLDYVSRHGFTLFAWWRVAVGTSV